MGPSPAERHKQTRNNTEEVRYVTNRCHTTSSVEKRLRKLQWPILEERRKKARLTLLYKVANGEVEMMLAINCYHLIDCRGTPTPNLSRYHHVRPASGKCPSIQKRLETGTTYTPKWRSRKSWLVQETTAYILTLSPMFLFAPVLFFCIAQTSFVTLGLFKYVPNTVRE